MTTTSSANLHAPGGTGTPAPALPPGDPSDAGPEPVAVRRSLVGQALYDTFGQTGARFGALWVLTIGFLGVAAPFVANSYPILYRARGGPLTSPMLRALTPLDVVLVVLSLAAAAVVWRRPGAGLAMVLIGWPVAVVGVVAAVVAVAPTLPSLSLWRPASLRGEDAFGGGAVLLWAAVVVLHLLVAAGLLLVAWLLARATVAMVRSTLAARRAGLLGTAVTAACLALAALYLVRPSEKNIYETYREAEARGEVELIVRTVVPYSPNDRFRDRKDVPGVTEQALRPPDRVHWLGTEVFRQDMLSRLIHGCRVALSIGLIATGISTVVGVVVGGLLGYFGGWLDLLGMRLIEILEAVPTLLVLLIISVSFGRSLYLMMVAIGLLRWTSDARFIRGEFFKLRNQDFVQAAIAAGLPQSSVIFRHTLPNGVAPVLVSASFGIAGAILLESTLSFLGLGLQEDPSWGQLLDQARSASGFKWWIGVFPGLVIFLTVFSYTLIGEAMRDALDPKLKKAH